MQIGLSALRKTRQEAWSPLRDSFGSYAENLQRGRPALYLVDANKSKRALQNVCVPGARSGSPLELVTEKTLTVLPL